MTFSNGIRTLRITLSTVLSVLLVSSAFASENPETVQRAASEAPSITPVAEVQLTTEQRVDRIFGVVVEQMVKVLFWDVAFWDNDASLTASDSFAPNQSLLVSDPLGWEIATFGDSSGKSFTKALEPKDDYTYEGRATVATYTSDGLHLFLGTDRGEILLFPREGGKAQSLFQAKGAIVHMVLHPSGNGIWAGDAGGQVIEIASLEGKPGVLATFKAEIRSLEFREGGGYALAASADGETRIFAAGENGTWVPETTLRGGGAIVHAEFGGEGAASVLTISADGRVVLQGTGGSGEWTFGESLSRVWSVEGGVIAQVASTGTLQALSLQSEATATPIDLGEAGAPLAGLAVPGAFYAMDAKGNVKKLTSGPEGWTVDASLGATGEGGSAGHLVLDRKGVLFAHNGKQGISLTDERISLPFVVFWLAFGAIFFTLRMGFVNVRMFRHAIDVVRGTYDNPNAKGEVTHFQALASALSATVGLGNIAGVAIAVSIGGPGATLWMIVLGIFGMAAKFAECTLGQKFRTVNADGQVMGGAMHYLSKGLAEKGMGGLGKGLAVLFAILCVGASFGGGNSFQVKQSLGVLSGTFPIFADYNWLYGLLMMIFVGIVILGGIKRIAQTAEKIVPAMCGIYVAACLYVILANVGEVGAAFATIFSGAFAPDSMYGGLVGVLVVGVTRAAFSNEAGIGSAAIAHAAAKTEYPIREGVVALLEPFIDTVVVCTMTALVIVITGAYDNPEYGLVIASKEGARLTSLAMAEEISWFPYMLSFAVVLFAYSTMISWSYYGERCWTWMFGERSSIIYKLLFLVFVFLGSIMTASNILDFSDLMILGMAIPNVLGVLLLSGSVRSDLDVYAGKLARGEFERFK